MTSYVNFNAVRGVGIAKGHRERLGLLKKRPLIRILWYQTRVPERGARDED